MCIDSSSWLDGILSTEGMGLRSECLGQEVSIARRLFMQNKYVGGTFVLNFLPKRRYHIFTSIIPLSPAFPP